MGTTGRIWVTGTTSLICFIAYTPQLAGLFDGVTRLEAFIFNVLVGLIFFNYYRCVRTNPGRVPAGWRPQAATGSANLHNGESAEGEVAGAEQDVSLGDLRYCKKCESLKPPRTHHCRYCKKCTLRFDHHCPWIDNCVGFHNYIYFLRFLFFVDISCAMHLYLLTFSTFNVENFKNRRTDPSNTEIALLVLNYVFSIPVFICVGLFSLYHFWNLSCNSTTLEGSEIEKVKKMVRKGKIRETIYPFNVGILANITHTIGSTPIDWLFVGKPNGNGTSFPSALHSDPLHWPPCDPYDALRQSWDREAREDVPKSRYPPYHPAYNALDAQDEDDERHLADPFDGEVRYGVEQDDDNVPLAHLRTRSVRLRRGSEGFEIRPRGIGVGSLDDYSSDDDVEPRAAMDRNESSQEASDADWNELYGRRPRNALYDSGSDDD